MRRSMEIPGPGTYQAMYGPRWKNYGSVAFGQSKRLLDTKETKKCKPPTVL